MPKGTAITKGEIKSMFRGKAAQAAGLMLLVMVVLAGCGSGRTGSRQDMPAAGKMQKSAKGYQIIVDDYAQIILRQDQDSARYEQALEQVGIYLEQPGREPLQAARDEVQSAVQELEQAAADISPYQPEEGFAELLAESGISYVEYAANADSRSESLYDYAQTLKNLDEYLRYEEQNDFTRGELQFLYEMSCEEHRITKGYCYYGINYWFAEWGEENLPYIEQQILGRLTSFCADEAVWEHSRAAVEQHMERYLNELEGLNAQWAEHLGNYQEEVYQQQQTVPQR